MSVVCPDSSLMIFGQAILEINILQKKGVVWTIGLPMVISFKTYIFTFFGSENRGKIYGHFFRIF